MSGRASEAVNANLDASIDQTAAQTAAKIQQQGAANLSAVAARQQAARDAESAAANASRQAAGVRQANDFVAQSGALLRQGNDLAFGFRSQLQGIQESAAASFARGQARGEYQFQVGAANRVYTDRDVGAEYATTTNGLIRAKCATAEHRWKHYLMGNRFGLKRI